MIYVKLGRTGLDVSASARMHELRQPAVKNQPCRWARRRACPSSGRPSSSGSTSSTRRMSIRSGSEEITGKALKEYARRDEIVLATKVFSRMREGPNWCRTVTQGDIPGN